MSNLDIQNLKEELQSNLLTYFDSLFTDPVVMDNMCDIIIETIDNYSKN